MLETAVLVLTFNRPEKFEKLLDIIREVKPSRLYISCDGPRLGNVEDEEKIEKTKRCIGLVDWNCTVELNFFQNKLIYIGKKRGNTLKYCCSQDFNLFVSKTSILILKFETQHLKFLLTKFFSVMHIFKELNFEI